MKTYTYALILLLFANLGFASPEQEAEKLLELSGTKEAMTKMSDMMLAQELQQNPTLVPFEQVLRDFFDKHLSYESIKSDFISLYTEVFTENELAAMNQFYASDVGQKAVKNMPLLMEKGGEIGLRRVQNNIGELQQMIAAEAERLKALGQQ